MFCRIRDRAEKESHEVKYNVLSRPDERHFGEKSETIIRIRLWPEFGYDHSYPLWDKLFINSMFENECETCY